MKDILSKTIGNLGFLGLLSKDKSVLGIDVGTSSLKIIQIKKERERAVLETYGELSTGAYSGQEAGKALLLTDEKISQMIIDLRKEAGATATRGVISIPLRYSFITVVDMPDLPEQELGEAVKYEARKYIPIPLNDVVLDWWRLPQSSNIPVSQGPKKTISILLVAVQKEIAEKYNRILTQAQIEPMGFEIEVFSPLRTFGSKIKGAFMVFDLGALSTKISIVENGIVRSVHHIDRASQAFTLAIAQSLGVDFRRAEQMKHDVGITQRPEAAGIRHTITPLLDSIFDEADRLRASYRRRFGGTVDRAVFIGGGSLMPGVVEYGIEKLGIEVIVGNPFTYLEYPPFLQPVLKNIAPSFSVSAGLALNALQGD